MARKISKARANAIKHGYRSGFEHTVSKDLTEAKVKFEYETTVISYIKPETHHTYTIDFTLPNGILVETKGRWVLEDRKKHLLIKKQHPELDIRFVFSNVNQRVQGSWLTCAKWCEKYNFKYAELDIPKEWMKNVKKKKN